jgi:hypothetical protein
VRAGEVIAQKRIQGEMLNTPLPSALAVQSISGEITITEAAASFGEYCGLLPLVWVEAGKIHTGDLQVPAPYPFQHDDIRAMWLARNSLRLQRRIGEGGEYEWARLAASPSEVIAFRYLQCAFDQARLLISKWPNSHSSTIAWRPTERPGGRVLTSLTERRTRGVASGPSGPVPIATARRFASAVPRRYRQLELIAHEVATRVAGSIALGSHPELQGRLVAVFREIAQKSRPLSRTVDPPMSTWPPIVQSTFASCVAVLAALRDIGEGNGSAPLTPLWELYETWVAAEVMRSLTNLLGSPLPRSGRAIGRWAMGGSVLSLYYQALIPPHGREVQSYGGVPLVSVVGELLPDLLVTLEKDTEFAAMVIDAKKYGRYVDSAALSQNASKYIWSIRKAGAATLSDPALNWVTLVAPLGGAAASHDLGRMSTLKMHPSEGLSDAQTKGLLARLESL